MKKMLKSSVNTQRYTKRNYTTFLCVLTGRDDESYNSEKTEIRKEGVQQRAANAEKNKHWFWRKKHEFADKYYFTDMYSGGFYPYDTLEEHRAYWSRYIYINRYMDAPKPVREQRIKIVE